MYYSKLGRSKLSVSGIYNTLSDGTTSQDYATVVRTLLRTYDTYQVNDGINVSKTSTDKDGSIVTSGDVQREIIGKVITHEIGDSQNDSILHSIVVEAIPFYELNVSTYRASHYDYADEAYPVLRCYMRAKPFNVLTTEKVIDLIELSYNSKGFLNPFIGIQQTPIETTIDNIPYTTSEDDIISSSESIVLPAPLNSKFRRMRMEYICTETNVVRAFMITYNMHPRKGYV